MSPPCKGCQEREATCHTRCERYLNYRRILDEKAACRSRKRAADAELADMSGKRADRIQRCTRRDIKLHNWGR